MSDLTDRLRAALDASYLAKANLRATTTADRYGQPPVEWDTCCVYDVDEDDPPLADKMDRCDAEFVAAAPSLLREAADRIDALETAARGLLPLGTHTFSCNYYHPNGCSCGLSKARAALRAVLDG